MIPASQSRPFVLLTADVAVARVEAATAHEALAQFVANGFGDLRAATVRLIDVSTPAMESLCPA